MYKNPNVDSEPFISGSEDLFDIFSCYFPISISRSAKDTHSIDKEDLALALHSAMAASPLFAEHCIPLLLEKLSSTLRLAAVPIKSLNLNEYRQIYFLAILFLWMLSVITKAI